MGNYWWCAILFRIFLPCSIIVAAFARPTITSYIYLLMGFYLPFFSVPTYRTMKGGTGTYIKVLSIVSILISSMVTSFYFALYFPTGEEYHMEPCGVIEQILRTVGVIQFQNLPPPDAVSWLLPEPLMLGTSLIMFVVSKKLTRLTDQDLIQSNDDADEPYLLKELHRKKMLAMLLNSGKYLIVFMFCVTAVIRPSVLGLVYYFIFLVVLTYWSCNKSLGKVYARILLCISPVICGHLTILFFYQMQYFQDYKDISPESLYGRLFQLVRINTYKDCHDPRLFKLHAHPVPTYALPYLLFLLYYLIVLVSREILQAKDGFGATFVAFFKRARDPDLSSRWKMAFKKVKEQMNEDKLNAIDETLLADRIRRFIENIIQLIITISYLVANFMIMIWSITYIGWKTLLLLMWANLVWLLPARRQIMLVTSPLLVIYVWFLLGTSYVYSMDVDIPETVGIIHLASGAHSGEKLMWVHLTVKSLFSVIIFTTMRQFFQERSMKQQQRDFAATLGRHMTKSLLGFDPGHHRSKTWRKIQQIVQKWFTLCWIWVVVITLIRMDFLSTNNPFRITFIAQAIIFVLTFQICPFNCWKKFLLFYWWLVIVYAMINLFVSYMYQLSTTRQLLHKYIYPEEGFRYIGFNYEQDTRKRLILLANPLFLQIAIVIQKNYLQEDFDTYTSPVSLDEIEMEQGELDEINPRVKTVIEMGAHVKNLVFTFLELHLQKIILMCGWLLCCYDSCAVFMPFVILLSASCIFGRYFTWFTIHFMSFCVQLFILARLVYMNQYTYHHSWDYVGHYERNGRVYNVTLNTADWLGFHRSSESNRADFYVLSRCFLFVFIVTLDPVVRLRQLNYKKSRNLPTTRQRVLFPEVTEQNGHDNMKNMLKYLVNYGFYKLGFELTAVMGVIVMAIRMDLVAVVLSISLLSTFSLNRKWAERVLMPIMVVACVWLPFQYFMSLGFWPTYWNYSYTRFWNENDFKVRIQQFAHLMNMAHPPPKEKLVYDFLLLMCLSRQWRMFRVVRQFREQEFGAGDNVNVGHLIDSEEVVNPVPDFVTYTRNFLDIYKKIFFFGWFYVSLLVTFLAGTVRPAIYSFGYILASFLMIWEGSEMFLRPPTRLVARWNMLIFYNLCILAFRISSQLFGCILVYEWKNINCKIYSMFNIVCVDRFNMTGNIPNMNRKNPCKLVKFDPVGLQWDCVCFFFLIIQQRIFKSYHFFHIINDAKAQTILADKGARLIEEQRQKKRQAYDNQDEFIRTNVKKKLKNIQDNRQKIQGDVYLRRKKNHKHMLRSGDYFLFDELENTLDIPFLPPKQEYVDMEIDPYDPMNLEEFVNCFLTTNLEGVLDARALRKHQKQAILEGKKPETLKMAVALRASRAGTSSTPDTTFQMETIPVRKAMNIFLLLWGLMESTIVSLTALINHTTKDFRHIIEEMDKDKKLLKEKTNYRRGDRIGVNKIWKPEKTYNEYFKNLKGQDVKQAKIHYTIYEKLLRSIWYLGISQSEWLCYLIIVLNQVIRANFISLPLPMMVFCWGSLTVPKPTKTFWVIMISHALIMSVIKNFFVMEIADWNKYTFTENSFYPPSVIGIDRYINSGINLSLLCALFFHRVVLQKLGLWEPFFYRTASLINDGNYNFRKGKLIPLSKNEEPARDAMAVHSSELSMGNYFPRSLSHGAGKYAEGFRLFIQQLISPSSTQIPVDVYTQMFWCDLINLLLIVFFYSYFEPYGGDEEEMGFVQYVQDNRVPMTYIFLIVAMCVMMVIDRWIYMRKNRYAKLIYHFFQVIAIHIYAFVLFPLTTGRVFTDTLVVQLFYIFKCIYFLYSAYQIRNGYPHLVSCHFLTHGTSTYYRYAFKLYQMIPYLFEMRTLLDWTCKDTSLGVSDFFKMEQISECVFDQKCQQDFEALLADSGGQRKSRTVKYLVGGTLFGILFLTVIFPFLLFSLSGSVGVTTHPSRMYLEVYMSSAEPIFKSYATQKNLVQFTPEQFENLTETFNHIGVSESLFGSFESEDVIVVKWSSHSLSSWAISPGGLKELIEDAKAPKPLAVRVHIGYTHVGGGGDKTDRVFGQSAYIPPLPNGARQDLIDMLSNGSSSRVVWLPLVFPKFLMITKEAKPKSLPIMEEPTEEKYKIQIGQESSTDDLEDDDEEEEKSSKRFRNLLLSLQSENGHLWWEIKEECNREDDNYMYYLKDLVHNSCENLVMYTFNEKVFSGTMHFVTGGGIMGLYFIYFMVVFGVIRSCMISVSEIWIEDLPNSDRLWRKCREVYVARDMENYELEEELVSELIFIMRSREICIKLTRYDDDPYSPTYLIPGTRRRKS